MFRGAAKKAAWVFFMSRCRDASVWKNFDVKIVIFQRKKIFICKKYLLRNVKVAIFIYNQDFEEM